MEGLNEEIKIDPIHTYQARNSHPPFTEIYRYQSLYISSNLHSELITKESN